MLMTVPGSREDHLRTGNRILSRRAPKRSLALLTASFVSTHTPGGAVGILTSPCSGTTRPFLPSPFDERPTGCCPDFSKPE